MREGWKYQKLGELVKVINGLWVGKKPPFTNVAVVRNANFTKSCTLDMSNIAYIDVEEKQFNTRELQYADIIIEKSGGSEKQPVGRPVFFNIKDRGYSFSNFTATLRVVSSDIVPEYLYKVLLAQYKQGVTKRLQSKTTGLHNLDFKSYLKSVIPIPSCEKQLSIVSELDKINELIRLKKEQLEDYDNLAQSIFYEMFGDPVVNEKGWEVKKFADLYKLKSGDSLSAKNFVEGEIPVYGGNGISGYHNDFNMDGDFIIIGRVGVYCGNVREVHGKFWLTDNAFQLFYNREIQYPCFIHYLLEILDLHQYANAAAQPVISNLTLKDVEIIIPPLPLQQLFAQGIELIEQQKAEIQSTIADLETLLASRMQYWFFGF